MAFAITGTGTDVGNRLIQADNLMVRTMENYDKFLQNWQLGHPNTMRDRFPLGLYPMGQGASQKSYIFRGSISGPQAGLGTWTDVSPSTKPINGVGGTDQCTYNPSTYTWAYDAIDYSGKTCSWRSPVFCARDLYTQTMAREQLAMILGAGAQVTDAVKETFNRETFMYTAAAAGKFIPMVEGIGLQFLDDPTMRIAYNPNLTDADGDTYIRFRSSLLPRLSTLNWSLLNLIRQYYAEACPDAAQGMEAGMPIFPLLCDLVDFEKMVYADADLREDFRYARSSTLIDGFNMGFKVYRGFGLQNDARQARYNVSNLVTVDGVEYAHAKRVVPRRAIRQGVIGLIPEANPDYINAEIGTLLVFPKDTLQILVPDTITSLGSGTSFGPAPGFNGQWQWLNYQTDENPLKEKGFFFSRFEYYVKVRRYAEFAMVIAYRRCPQVLKTKCAADVESSAVDTATLAVAAVASDIDSVNNRVKVNLSAKLTAGVGDAVTLTDSDSRALSCVIAEAANAPTYVLMYTGTDPVVGKLTVAATVAV
jgi:hypothetical protein